MLDFRNISNAVRQTSFGVWVIDEDTHFTKWIEEEQRLDHHGGFLVDLLPFIPDGGVVIDVGAYIGDHTVAYINKSGPSGTVYAFEPNPVAFFCLTKIVLSEIFYDWCRRPAKFQLLCGRRGQTSVRATLHATP